MFIYIYIYTYIYIHRFLTSLPPPWGPTGKAEETHEVIAAIQLLQRRIKISKESYTLSTTHNPTPTSSSREFSVKEHSSSSSSSSTKSSSCMEHSSSSPSRYQGLITMPPDISMWLNSIARRTPAFIINLDRRPDRMRTITKMCNNLGISGIRVSAIDGNRTKALSDISHNGSMPDIPDIPDTDVTRVWDSTLNNMYDSKCTINKFTPMTPSERACAASHLNVWRTIAAIRDSLFQSSNSTTSHLNLNANISSSTLNKSNSDTSDTSSNNKNGNDSSKRDTVGHDSNHNLVEISRGCYRLSHMGGGWIPVHMSVAEKKNQKKNASLGSTVRGSDNDTDWYLVLEDDAEAATTNLMSEGFQITLNKVLQKVPPNFDICYLGHVIPHHAEKRLFRGGDIIKTKYAWCLHAYVLRGKAVDVLLKNLPISAPVDNFMAQMLHDEIIEVSLFFLFRVYVYICVYFYDFSDT
jgi:GR25 family glycosyltransferase involved in LPS biosynthesis